MLELLTEAAPGVRRVGVLSDPMYRGSIIPALEAAARSLAVELRPVPVRTADEFDTAFMAMIANCVRSCPIVTPIAVLSERGTARLHRTFLHQTAPAGTNVPVEEPSAASKADIVTDLLAAIKEKAFRIRGRGLQSNLLPSLCS
jgi:hypothetical protein